MSCELSDCGVFMAMCESLTSYGDDSIEALVPKGEIKVVTYHDFTPSIPGNLYQRPAVVTA